MSGGYEIDVTSWEAAFDQLYMTFQEKMINEAYELYTTYKKKEHQKVNKLIQQLKERNVEFKLIVGEGTTTLHLMSFHGNLGMVKLLVEMYGNAEAKDENQRTPLHLACIQGHLEIAQYLYFECGCSLQCGDKDGWSPVGLAHFHNHTDIVKYFNVHGQSPKADLMKIFQGINQLYQLFTGYKKRDFHLITESNSHLCVLNVKFVLRNENCFTTLHFMCALGVLEGVKNLIEMYGNVEVRDEKGRTPLHIACARGHNNISLISVVVTKRPEMTDSLLHSLPLVWKIKLALLNYSHLSSDAKLMLEILMGGPLSIWLVIVAFKKLSNILSMTVIAAQRSEMKSHYRPHCTLLVLVAILR